MLGRAWSRATLPPLDEVLELFRQLARIGIGLCPSILRFIGIPISSVLYDHNSTLVKLLLF